jgi:hypothetical protein
MHSVSYPYSPEEEQRPFNNPFIGISQAARRAAARSATAELRGADLLKELHAALAPETQPGELQLREFEARR